MRRDGGSVFPARANTGDPNGPVGGLSANEIARALISMMARSTTCSNQRPDTLMRDRICRIEENLLQRTAGPYIRVRTDKTQSEHNESSVHLLADIGANIGLCRDGPKPVIYRFYAGGCDISSRAFNGLLAICEGLRHLASKIDEELRDRTEPAFRPLRRLI